MVKRKRGSGKKRIPRHTRSRSRSSPPAGASHGWRKLRNAANGLTRTADASVSPTPPWKWLPWILLLAFALRAAVALSGDFTLHPDEIMQYLEPAHRQVFGNGMVYWEHYYGARFYLIPMIIAAVLQLFAALGLDQPLWYVGAVKVLLCAVSLLIPAGMYVFARRHFGETSARIALLAGAFWYELIGFAHKPMTEFIATALFIPLLAVCVRPPSTNTNTDANTNALDSTATIWMAAALAVLVAVIRLQYAPFAAVALAVVFIRTDRKLYLALAVGACVLAAGVYDALYWGRGLFHSHLINLRYNLHPAISAGFSGESDIWQFMRWLLPASAGLSALVAALALREVRRYGFLLILIAVIILIHSLQAHKEYRFIFLVIPLWLMLFADIVARLPLWAGAWKRTRTNRRAIPSAAAIAVIFTAISAAGLLNALPAQQRIYNASLVVTEVVGFLRNQDPIFDAYRYLAAADNVRGVWQSDRLYLDTPGYYYLHHRVPFYDSEFGQSAIKRGAKMKDLVSHIVVDTSTMSSHPGFVVEKVFGDIHILRRQPPAPVGAWEHFAPVLVSANQIRIMRNIDPAIPEPRVRIPFRTSEVE